MQFAMWMMYLLLVVDYNISHFSAKKGAHGVCLSHVNCSRPLQWLLLLIRIKPLRGVSGGLGWVSQPGPFRPQLWRPCRVGERYL